jgi:hypothetical protein
LAQDVPPRRVRGAPRVEDLLLRLDDAPDLRIRYAQLRRQVERLYLRGADLAIVNSGTCSLLAQAERLECLEKLSRDIAPSLRRAVSPSAD